MVVHPPWCRGMGASVPLPPFTAPGFVACSNLAVGEIEVVVLKTVTGFPDIGDVVSGGVSSIFAFLLAWYCLNQWSRICSFGWSNRCYLFGLGKKISKWHSLLSTTIQAQLPLIQLLEWLYLQGFVGAAEEISGDYDCSLFHSRLHEVCLMVAGSVQQRDARSNDPGRSFPNCWAI